MDHKHHEHMENGHEHHKVISTGSNPCTDRLTDIEYLEHMIPHHQVAVDMSKVLLKNTNKDYMVFLAYRIIRKQQEEIYLLNEMKKNINSKSFVFKSNLCYFYV